MQAISRRLGHQSPFSSSSHLKSIYFLSNDYCHEAADNPRYASTLATKGVGHLVRKDTGGRSSISGNVAVVFGATGFLGRLAKQLATVSAEGECKTNFLRSPFIVSPFTTRCFATMGQFTESPPSASSASDIDPPTRIKFKRPDKTAKHIMQILDREAVEEVKKQREIPDIRPGYIVQLKVEVPENKRRVSVLKGIVIARRNAGLNTTFRIRRLVAGVGIESLFPLYSPNIKEIKVLDKKKVRRAKLYYLRDKMNALKKQ